jgi:enoyl-CoA hydratase
MADYSEAYDQLDVALDGDVFRITFDKPNQYNAIRPEVHEELADVFRDANRSDARVVLLTGRGDAFSSGGDIERMQKRIDDPEQYPFEESIRQAETVIRDIVTLDQPFVAKVNGDATGLGATLALLADISVMSAEARIGDTHVKAGYVAGDGGAIIWPLLVGVNRAKEFLMTGKLIDAQEAEEMGLVNYVVPPAELDEKTEAVVDELASGPQLAMQYTKRAINGWLELGVNNVLRDGLAHEAISQQQPDHEAAVKAFLEGEEPDFPSGRSSDDG